MKIAHVVSTFPPHIGGMGRVVYEEVERLSKRNHEVAVFTLRYPNDIRDVEKDAMNRVSTIPFKVVHLKPLFRMGDGGEIPQLFFALQQADLIHLHYPFYGGEEWVLLAAKWFKKPYVVTYHMDAVLEGGVKKFLQAIYDYVWAWNVLKNAHTVIGIDRTHFLGTQFGQKLLNYRKCVEIKLGVDADIFKPSGVHANLPLLKDRDDKKIILFVGNLIPVKHLDTLLEAFKEVSFFETDVELVVVGDGVERKRYERLVHELNITDLVTFVGAVSDKKILAEYYNAASMVVVPSERESFSLVASEAMASGKVVIASDIPILKERVHDQEDGFLFKMGDPKDLERAITRVLHLSDEERKSVENKAYEKIRKNCNWEKHVDELEEVYRSMVTK